MRLRNFVIFDVLFSAIVALIFTMYKGFSFGLFVAVFAGLSLGSICYALYGRKSGYKRIREAQIRMMEQFKERLVEEGVIDETEDIARAKRIPWVKEKDILLMIKDFAEIVHVEGRTYAIHRETLNKLLSKFPLKDEEISQLTCAERRVLEIAQAAGILPREKRDS